MHRLLFCVPLQRKSQDPVTENTHSLAVSSASNEQASSSEPAGTSPEPDTHFVSALFVKLLFESSEATEDDPTWIRADNKEGMVCPDGDTCPVSKRKLLG
ncbi:hypothetical protein L2E82_32210 [Cichorium intybus]|uniref:Uncharacterized protein n=1 Tax=Cichorium intybus TaxID=13427 RepID=A0ACB9BFS0_CICIN|nr:hypothetical protein L2E82_32210 [Cichorium intybus]